MHARSLFPIPVALAIACGSTGAAPGGAPDTSVETPDGADGTGDASDDTPATPDAREEADGDPGADVDAGPPAAPFPVVDTDQNGCFDAATAIVCPGPGDPLYGQDAHYATALPRYRDNADGTVTDLVTGLMWRQDPGAKMTWAEAVAGAAEFDLAGYDDWRLPTISELYSLMNFDGRDASTATEDAGLTPFLRDDVFVFRYGDTSAGERLIDAQYATSTEYVSETIGGHTMFGVNFADGRIKGYPTGAIGPNQLRYFVLYVRGTPGYGDGDYADNGDGTVRDATTGLTWQRGDSGEPRTWADALAYCEGLVLGTHDDWRLPDVKELQTLVDYTRSPDTTGTAAIDPVFVTTPIVNEAGDDDFGCYWSSTTHVTSTGDAEWAAYIAFGRAMGFFGDVWQDVHGAGAQRSDPKSGSADEYPEGHGPQGDAVRVLNFARCVRGGAVLADATTFDAPSGEGSGEGPQGPVSCDAQDDCDAPGACPDGAALGCACTEGPGGDLACIPRCDTDDDCPTPPDMTLECAEPGVCVPSR